MLHSYVMTMPLLVGEQHLELDNHFTNITDIVPIEDLIWAVAQHPTDPNRALCDLCTEQENLIDGDPTLDPVTRLELKDEWYQDRVMSAIMCIDALAKCMAPQSGFLLQPYTSIHNVKVRGDCMVVTLSD